LAAVLKVAKKSAHYSNEILFAEVERQYHQDADTFQEIPTAPQIVNHSSDFLSLDSHQQLHLKKLCHQLHKRYFLEHFQYGDQGPIHSMIPFSCTMKLNFLATRPLRVIITSWDLQHYSMLFLWKILKFQVPPFLTKKQLKKPIVAVKGGESWQHLRRLAS
jgi:hypothetical protein